MKFPQKIEFRRIRATEQYAAYAPHGTYGGPEGLKRLVDACPRPRLSHHVRRFVCDNALVEVIVALVMTAPFIPMLFQGAGWGASTPTVACNRAAGMQRVLLRPGLRKSYWHLIARSS